jgi:hypothetical protein
LVRLCSVNTHETATKALNSAVLFLCVGYDSNLENVNPELCVYLPGSAQCNAKGPGLLRTQNRLSNDSRQVFIKLSYLFRR